MSVVVVATIRPLPEHVDEVKRVYAGVVPQVHAEDGCELYALHEGDGTLVMVEQWSSLEALQAHGRAEALTRSRPLLEGRLAGPADVVVLHALPHGDDAKGRLRP